MPHLIVSYGHPTDPAAFDAHYVNNHKPLADRIPGVVRWHAGHCASLDDTQPEHYAMAVLTFATNEDLSAGMASTEGRAAIADIPNYATGGATVTVVDDLV
ncbi:MULTISPECIES: EthD family reductase [Dietzia]|uniref:EthD family reductase n=1 Tax=Dietzia TaxID=37914 RepID=UPI0027231E8D|nr:EthD family reductase [Dietzia sp.]MDO8395327.1 EthD family reductase [Dietzia sp.]